MHWQEIMTQIQPLSEQWLSRAWERLDSLTKPLRSLGKLEEIAARVAAIREEAKPDVTNREVFVFAGDHGVVEEGVSAYPQDVTALMVRNFLAGGAAINVLARCAEARVSVIDIGMKTDLADAQGLIRRNVRRATGNILRERAMTVEEAERALSVGIETAFGAYDRGAQMIATGEMGIGNTTPSSALFAGLLPAAPLEVTGRGTGLETEQLHRKAAIIEEALKRHRFALADPLSALAALGGLEIAGICGLCLGGAAKGLIVVVDGFISSAGALVAMRLCPAVREYLFFSHLSSEAGHRIFYEKEGLAPLFNLDMRLGEGTGAALAMQVIGSAVRIYNEMATFEEAGIAPGA
ncbi:nicotinate-nucleotide--dimethylbenzimidazole phosphoribosyltransferase [Desulfatiglans anilini]|uniref:nicotinate-nucleotide--dimethylbenzimidazole phosphoribosyltransferase n=1 Tax=Desulfatiglans anilini TaxID=90728 RepID=UPI0004256D35|nr:nicotinate-nucleotide--dimethylbenzimidazole phosphoribosyltransferase [Desulfatiglans anilini]